MATAHLICSHNYALVALSVLIAMFASYAALDLAGRVTAAGGWTRAVWLLGGAGAMGTGIWSMHYIGMLACILPVPVAYHWPTVLLSLFAAILASAIALYVVSRQKMGAFRAFAGSILMGGGIASMHYIGMAAMRLAAICHYNSLLVLLSVVFAVLICLAALWITFHLRDEKAATGLRKMAGAIVMGAAIPVMHYTGMAAAHFTPSGMPADLSRAISISALGTVGIAAVTFIVLGLALLTSWVDRRFAAQTLELQEQKLQRSEAYLEEAQRLSHTGSFGWKVSTGEIAWSDETFRIFQYDRTTTPTVESVLQRVHPEDAALVKQTIERASQEGQDFDFERRLLLPDGSVKHVHVVAHAKRDEPGGPEFVGAVMDTTENKQAEQALRRSESNLAEAQRLTHTGSWAWRVAGREAVHLSEEWYRIYGFDPGEGIPTWEERLQRVHPEDRAKWKGTIDRAISEKSDYQVEFRILLRDGTVKYIHTVGHPVLNASGDLVEFVGSATDITERKRAEMLMGGEKRLLEMIARGDTRAHILDALCRLVEELASGALTSILLLDPKTGQLRHGAAPSLPIEYTEAIDGAVIGPCVGSCGTAAYRSEPVIVSDIATDPLWVNFRDLALGHGLRACWSTPILSSAGKVLGTFAIYYREPRSASPQEHELVEQITHLASIAVERAQAEEALRQAQADLAHVSRVTTMGELTASIAHEVNQPLTAVVNNANACLDLLEAAPKRPGQGGPQGLADFQEVRDALTEIVDDTNRASAVITRVRQLAKKAPFERMRLHLKEVIADVLALARYECATRQTIIRADLIEDLPLVLGDRVQLQQVLLNLVVNGMDAMNAVEESKRILIISGRSQIRDGIPEACLSVQDAGTGFKPREMERLFEAFYTTKAHGMGMGLAISRSIIEAHGGRLWAEPNQGPGATFSFTLPAAPKPPGEGGPAANEGAVKGGTAISTTQA